MAEPTGHSLAGPASRKTFAFKARRVWLAPHGEKLNAVHGLVLWAVPFAVLFLGHVVFRVTYYGEWLPNVFYAKVSGIWLTQGGRTAEIPCST